MHRPRRHEGDHVQREVQRPHGEERSHQGDRDGNEHDERRSPSAQEEEQHERGGDDALHEIQPGLIERGIDERAWRRLPP